MAARRETEGMDEPRVLDNARCTSLADYEARGGGEGLKAARRVEPEALVEELEASGLRGRGGAGFPTGLKWRTVASNASPSTATSVVVNAAEGEPGTFKDRAILRTNPYRTIEGALIAARVVNAREVVVATKASFSHEIARLTEAIAEINAAGWNEGVSIRVALGPSAYLFGEETALLEVLDGRPPFPRIAAPYREGVGAPGEAAEEQYAGVAGGAPALMDNVETLANVPMIVARGAQWFRSVGTAKSPGTIVCTISGDVPRHGVVEVPMGTTLREVLSIINSTDELGEAVTAVLPGASNAILPASFLDVPLTYEDAAAAGSALGSASFILFDASTDLVSVAHGVARFLSVESCGQCLPCKRDGMDLRDALDRVRVSQASDLDLLQIGKLVENIPTGSRCYLAQQQQNVVGSLLSRFPEALQAHLEGSPASPPVLIAPIVDLVAERFALDDTQLDKQPDWSHADEDSGTFPAARGHDVWQDLAMPTGVSEPELSGLAPRAEEIDRIGELEGMHRQVEDALSAVEQAPDDERQQRWGHFRTELALYTDVLGRVLYPMLRRVAEDEGETVVSVGEQFERDTIALIDGAGDGPSIAKVLQEVATHVRVWLVQHERRATELLVARMAPEDLEELDKALAEAREQSLVGVTPNENQGAAVPVRSDAAGRPSGPAAPGPSHA
ncbi:MAG: hypothetical protein JWL70_825 [Acidimicrobiia bacterium]|nr:hypothetical protein [Acidimicrobiia bacterium]